MNFSVDLLPHTTSRLLLRRFEDGDLEPLVAYRNDPEVARYQSWSVLTSAEARLFIWEMQRAELGAPGAWFQVAIAARETNRLLGDIGFCVSADRPTEMEVGFTLAASAQGYGYAREAVQAWLTLAFQHTPVRKIVAITDQRNTPSRKLLQALGMQKTSTDEREFKGELCREETYVMRADRWKPAHLNQDAPK